MKRQEDTEEDDSIKEVLEKEREYIEKHPNIPKGYTELTRYIDECWS